MGKVLEIKGILIEYVDYAVFRTFGARELKGSAGGLVVAVGFTPADGGEKPHPQTRSCG